MTHWKKWCCWTLDEEKIKFIAEENGYDFDKFTEEEKDSIAERFKEWLHQSESEWWCEWIKNAINDIIEIDDDEKVSNEELEKDLKEFMYDDKHEKTD